MPTSSFDTFFACTIIIAAVLIGTAFLASTMATRIESTQDINKGSYLKAIANHIVTSPGSPADWGTSSTLPTDFGLVADNSNCPYELDMDKICRLNSLNNYSLSYPELSSVARLSVALGIKISQLMTVNLAQINNSSVGIDTSFIFRVSTNIDSKPTATNLHCYVAAGSYLTEVNGAINHTGAGQITLKIPTSEIGNALLIVFAKAAIDNRITSYAIYNFANSTQESTPRSSELVLSPLDYTLKISDTGFSIQNVNVFFYSHQETLSSFENSQAPMPKLIDQSPIVIVVGGFNGVTYFQEWTAYPQVPLNVGANFAGSEQNVFSYIVTINGVLYRLELSLGDLPN
jgi:hypothetical protein